MNEMGPGWEKEVHLRVFETQKLSPTLCKNRGSLLEKFKGLKIHLTNKVILPEQSLSCMWHN